MAFRKYANAVIPHPVFGMNEWGNFVQHMARTPHTRVASIKNGNLIQQASEILGEDFNPKNYVLSHATIVASVDVKRVPGITPGRIKSASGEMITRRWDDYRITPETLAWINNNQDSWSRPVLLKSYQTFIGGHNFQEHLQIEAQSKGRILDAVARDIGPSVYVDILVATNRKHAQLVKDIEDKVMTTLSMGCTTQHTTCTKCGNVAVDESELCGCVRYEKGNTFYDEQGMPCKVAELCGHESEDPTGGVQFIEASWVKVPAFTGAVMRNILTPDVIDLDRMKKVLDTPPPQWSEDQTIKAAKLNRRRAGDFDFGDFGDEGGGEGEEKPEEKKKEEDPLDALEGDIEQTILDRVTKRLKDKIRSKTQEEAAKPEGELATATNQGITHDASDHSLERLYRQGVGSLVKTAKDNTIFLNQMILHNTNFGIYIPKRIYKVALQAGPTAKYGKNIQRYLKVCEDIHGRRLTSGEAKTLIRLGHLLSLRSKIRPSTKH